ncbi:MAG: DNA polymerase/3'-5' exonuclease PolX [Candidatus Omnitrophica bacterium]|nr:DNA polymerase/3'-5' exonuclease PolX [Candidatus Omnitrophota bacterium]
MNNTFIAEIFDKIALLLELQDDNPFRIRAYRRAALNVQALTEDVAQIAGRKELEQIPGIGADLAKKIVEFLETGKVHFYEELHRKTPSFLLEMLEIPGVGPKTAKLIYRRLKPRDMSHLKNLALAGKLKGLPGIQEKTERNILEGIDLFEKHHERTLLGKALPLARHIVAELAGLKGVLEIAYAGSVRRMCETIGDIDILIASEASESIMNAFVRMKDVSKVLAHGATKSSVVMREGIQVDLRVVERDCFGAALLYFTGSQAHNIQLRSLAKKMGRKISEYGLFDNKTGRRLASRREEDIYKALGLAAVPPELREDQGEIDAAAKGALPRLVEERDVKGDFHLHSKWSDGAHEIEEMAESARKRGLEYVVLTDHSQSLRVAHGLSPKELLEQIEMIRSLNKKLKGITLLAGSEVDILSDGSLDYPDEILKKLDFAVASIHSGFKQSKEQITKRLVRAMRNPYVRLIGHPSGRLLGERNPYEADWDEVFRAASETNTALEINCYPQRLDLNAIHARRAREMGVMLAVNTDSHTRDQFANLEYGIAVARRAWCEKKDILNCLELKEFKKRITK